MWLFTREYIILLNPINPIVSQSIWVIYDWEAMGRCQSIQVIRPKLRLETHGDDWGSSNMIYIFILIYIYIHHIMVTIYHTIWYGSPRKMLFHILSSCQKAVPKKPATWSSVCPAWSTSQARFQRVLRGAFFFASNWSWLTIDIGDICDNSLLMCMIVLISFCYWCIVYCYLCLLWMFMMTLCWLNWVLLLSKIDHVDYCCYH